MHLTAAGTGFGGSSDRLTFVHQSRDGDVELAAEVMSIEAIHPDTFAALVLRSSHEPDAPFAALVVTADGRIEVLARDHAGDAPRLLTGASPTHIFPVHLRLQRRGPSVHYAASADGVSWSSLAESVWPAGPTLTGIAVASRQDTVQASFELHPAISP